MTIESEPLEGRRAHGEAAHRLQAELEAYWADMLADAEERHQVAEILGLSPEQMEFLRGPPVQVQSAQANAGGAEIGLIVLTWLATEVVLGAFKDLAKEEVKRRVKLVWEYVSDRLDDRMGGKATGWPAVLPPTWPLPLGSESAGYGQASIPGE
jgi:hypothetical protein